MKNKKINKIGILLVCIATLLILTAITLKYFIAISGDISLPYSIWLKGDKSDQYIKGSYVMAYPVGTRSIKYDYIIKQISCVAGDKLTVKKDGNIKNMFCNDELIGEVLSKDRTGEKIESFMISDELLIPNGYYFLSGTHKRSYDSRYFGLVDIEKIVIEVHPLL